ENLSLRSHSLACRRCLPRTQRSIRTMTTLKSVSGVSRKKPC
ncbi:uncharacterized protein METZ01_LOCUS433764, partial [marine metagenome]